MPVLWTASPFILAGAIALAWLVARIRATGIRPGRGLAALLSGRPKAERTLLVLVLVAAWVAGGTKPGGGGGANNVPNVANERGCQLPVPVPNWKEVPNWQMATLELATIPQLRH